MDLNLVVPVHLEDSSDRVFAVPASVLRVYTRLAAETVYEVGDVEGVRCCDHQTPIRFQVAPYALEESPHIVDVLDDLACEDDLELPAQIEVPRITDTYVVSPGSYDLDSIFIEIDADDVVALLSDEPVNPIGPAVWGGGSDI